MVFADMSQMIKPQVAKIGDMTIYTLAGQVHRTDGPAIITSWSQEWFINGVAHRSDGPAKLYMKHPQPTGKKAIAAEGKMIAEWYFDGKYTHQAIFYEHEKAGFMEHWHKGE